METVGFLLAGCIGVFGLVAFGWFTIDAIRDNELKSALMSISIISLFLAVLTQRLILAIVGGCLFMIMVAIALIKAPAANTRDE